MNRIIPYLAFALSLFVASCGSGEKQTESSSKELSNAEIEEKATNEAESSNITGYENLDELSREVVASIKANDYADYLKHVMTEGMENTVVKEIQNEEKRDYFLGEFGFSLEREQEEFENLIKYFNDRGVSLDSINYDEVEVIDYHHDDYAPLVLKEVVIIVPHEYDILLIYTAIKIKDRWFLTSELEV